MDFKLLRDTRAARFTLGVLVFGDKHLQTLERPWVPDPTFIGGTKGVSCVPVGKYRLERHDTEAHHRTWALVNPDLGVVHWEDDNNPKLRTAVLIHPANYTSELRGCIAPGLKRNPIGQVEDSRLAFIQITSTVKWDDSHTIEIGDI